MVPSTLSPHAPQGAVSGAKKKQRACSKRKKFLHHLFLPCCSALLLLLRCTQAWCWARKEVAAPNVGCTKGPRGLRRGSGDHPVVPTSLTNGAVGTVQGTMGVQKKGS
jgi:hypothetical protein